MRPQVSLAELYAGPAPGNDAGLMGVDGFRQLWSAHAATTPKALWSVMPASPPETVARVRRGEFPLFMRTVRVTPQTDWHFEPFHEVEWPRVHVDSCPYVVPGADLVILRDLNRMDFPLPHTPLRIKTTGELSFAAGKVALMDSWAEGNPYRRPQLVGPDGGGIRLFEWSIALAGISDAAAPSNQCCEHILRSVFRQSEFLAGHFSTWAIPNNHLVGEAATLAAFAPTGRCSSVRLCGWRRRMRPLSTK
jgi:hypothetical protein